MGCQLFYTTSDREGCPEKIAGFCTDFRRDRSLLLPGYYDFGSTFTVGVPRGYFYCSDDGSERSTVCRCTLHGTDSFKCRTGKEPFAFDQPLYDDDDADQQCSAVAWCPSVYGTLGRAYGTVPVQPDRSWGSHFIHTRADMALSEGEKRWLSDKDFGLRRAVKPKITFTTGTISCMINVAFARMEKRSAKRSLNNEME